MAVQRGQRGSQVVSDPGNSFAVLCGLSALAGRLGFLLLRPAFRRFKRRVDYEEYGGAPLLGLNGVSIICHGRSSPKAIKNAVLVARDFVAGHVNRHIRDDIERHLHRKSGGPA